ncbi:transposase [Waddlia chondrophila 2032/99]|uniref:Transposase n=1 Tax=Waddlia chondrophila 2032/99 TaxID=765953 RepID=F8LAM6_9BACT|nr:transposase [Waddlia chondrophila 2032/99]
MKNDVISLDKFHATSEMNSLLEQTLREGARLLLQQAIENEVNEYLESMKGRRDFEGRKQFVRNGYLPEREVQTGIGPISVKQPRMTCSPEIGPYKIRGLCKLLTTKRNTSHEKKIFGRTNNKCSQ